MIQIKSCRSNPSRTLTLLSLSMLLTINLAAQVKVSPARGGKVLELTVGTAGIAIPSETSFSGDERATLAPVQYFIYADGAHSDSTPNFISILYPRMGGSGVTAFSFKWLVRSADQCKVQLTYSFRKGDFVIEKEHYPGGGAGPGTYRVVIDLRKDAKSIMITEEYDYDIMYSVNVSNGLNPDEYRYRGWASTDTRLGSEAPGKKYRTESERGYPMDATGSFDPAAPNQRVSIPYWEAAGAEVDLGRYLMLYSSGGAARSNMLGLFHGDPSRLIGGRGYAMNVMQMANDPGGKPHLELIFGMDRRGADNSWYPRKRYEWGVYLSTKADLQDPRQVQPVMREMNRRALLGSRIDDYAAKTAVITPSFYKGAVFSDGDFIARLIARVKQDEPYYKLLVRSDSYYKPLFDAWRNADSARSLLASLLRFRSDLIENYKDGEGPYRADIRYWKGANLFKQQAIMVSCLFADPTIKMTDQQRAGLESLVRLMARILWDDANAPMQDSAGINNGTANMPTQYWNARYFFALLLHQDPEFSARAKRVPVDVDLNISNNVYRNGSVFGTPHYAQPAIEPLLFSMLQLKYAGVSDLFRSRKVIRPMTDFFMSLLTPRSPRFAGNRKVVSFGDGTEESSVIFALLAAGYRDMDRKLSRELASAFLHGPAKMSLFGPLFLVTDLDNDTLVTPSLSGTSFRGYLSTHRMFTGTDNETAAWILNGDSLFDHRNDDAGELAMYALGAPLSLSRSSFYSPQATDSRIRSVVLPETLFPEWNGPDQPIDKRSLKPRAWPASDQVDYARMGFTQVSLSRMSAEGLNWYRRVVTIGIDPARPFILVMDSLDKVRPYIWSMLFMAEPTVGTPAGPVTPQNRVHDGGGRRELPSGTPEKAMGAGLNRFAFTGQSWSKTYHPTGGIDWDLWMQAPSSGSFSMAQWTTTWHNSAERDDFQKANGRPYEETQQILRVKNTRPMFAAIMPRGKGQASPDVKPIADGFSARVGADLYQFDRQGFLLTSGKRYFAASWDEATFDRDGFSLGNGPVEVEVSVDSVIVRVHGRTGKRNLVLPVEVQVPTPVSGITVDSKTNRTVLTIDWRSTGTDQLSYMPSFREFRFRRRS